MAAAIASRTELPEVASYRKGSGYQVGIRPLYIDVDVFEITDHVEQDRLLEIVREVRRTVSSRRIVVTFIKEQRWTETAGQNGAKLFNPLPVEILRVETLWRK